MRFSFALSLLVASQTVAGFAPVSRWRVSTALQSTLESQNVASVQPVPAVEVAEEEVAATSEPSKPRPTGVVPLTEAEINARLGMQMEKLQAKDRTSTQLSKEVSGHGLVLPVARGNDE
jgi:hypothetical protein